MKGYQQLITAMLLCFTLVISLEDGMAVHPRPGQTGARGTIMQTPIYLKSYYSNDFISSGDDPSDGKFDNLPPLSVTETCRGCHDDIVSNEHKNRHATLGYEQLPLYGRGSFPERPWVQGPGKYGNWGLCTTRQLADMTKTYANSADFLAKVDLAAYDFVKECGVCHVGGGPAVSNPYGYTLPFPHENHDDPNRAVQILLDQLLPLSSGQLRIPLNPWDFYVKKGEVTWGKWSDPYSTNQDSGVLQQDCLICHLQGYNHLGRNEQIIRYEKYQNAATIGSGLATLDPAAAPPYNFDYNASYVVRNGGNHLYLASSFTDRISKYPTGSNCVMCHMPTTLVGESATWKEGFYAYDAVPSSNPADPGNIRPARPLSDFLKRGDTWKDGDVHKFIECGGCHSATGKFQAYDPVGFKGGDPAKYMHSPGKGFDPALVPYDQMDGTVKMCTDCHVLLGDLNGDGVVEIDTLGAPDPRSDHERAGLEMKVVPGARRIKDSTGTEETFTGSHVDVLSCTACHVNKSYAAARSFDYSTGGQFFNYVGSPLTTIGVPDSVPLAFSWKENTTQKVLANGQPNTRWRRQIFPFNYVSSIYWNNIGTTDANGDGYRTGDFNQGKTVIADPFFLRTVWDNFSFDLNSDNDRIPSGLKNVSAYATRNQWGMTNQSGAITFTQPGEIDAYQALIKAGNAGFTPQLMVEAEPYLLMHNIPRRTYAVGKPTKDASGTIISYGCNQCHGATGGIFNGSYDMLGKGKMTSTGQEIPLTISWNDIDDVKTKAAFWDRNGTSKTFEFSNTNSTRVPERWEFLGYDTPRVAALNAITPASVGLGIAPVAVINPITDLDPATPGIQIHQGYLNLSAPDAASVGTFVYTWTFSDGSPAINGQSIAKMVTLLGSLTINLKVVDEEGLVSQASTAVDVVGDNPVTISYNNVTKIATFAGLPQPNYRLKIIWGDGTSIYVITGNVASKDVPKSYATPGEKTVKVYVLDSAGTQIGYKSQIITVM